MPTRKTILSTLFALLLFAPAMAATADAQVNVPVTQTISGVGTLTGNLAVTSFKVVDGQLMAVGTLTGRITDLAGNLLGTVASLVTMPASATGTCDILHLTLGPLDLNLLGLQVHLDQIVLDITAQSGSGNLVGNLLCSIAGLLDAGGPLSQIANLLNQLLKVLG